MKRLITLILLLSAYHQLLSQAQMDVLNPESWWEEDKASIENVDLLVRPAGLFAEVQLSFDVLASNNFLSSTGVPLEYVLEFSMPEEAVFNDSWLWIDSYISVGELYERSEGTEIYEGIVDRRQDPSILTKHSSNNYSLRVYPLDPDSTRRVMLSYLIPFKYDNKEAYVDLPFHIFDASNDHIQRLKLNIIDSYDWIHYEPEAYWFDAAQSSGQLYTYRLFDLNQAGRERITFMPRSYDKEYYFGTYSQVEGNFFQLSYFPELDSTTNSKYHLIVIDYDSENNNFLNQNSLLNSIEKTLKEGLSENDFFNICYSSFITRFSFNSWMEASDENIVSAINMIKNNGIDHNSRLDVLLAEALFFVSEQESLASIQLISSNTEYYRENEADLLYEHLQEYIDTSSTLDKFNILDYANRNRYSWYIDGIRYTGNEYLYSKLINLKNGNLQTVTSSLNLDESLQSLLNDDKIILDEFNININSNDGFSYSRFVNVFNEAKIEIDKGIHITGKYVGDFPFRFEFQGLLEDQIINNEVIIERPDAMLLDNTAVQAWNSQYILNNEFSSQVQVQYDVIETSKEHNLLSYKTVFLCLEPDSIAVNTFDNEEGPFTSTSELDIISNIMSVSPNPFHDQFELKLSLKDFNQLDDTRLEIFDLQGRLLWSEIIQFNIEGDYAVYTFNDILSLNQGMLVIRISNDYKVYTTRASFIKE